MRFNVVYLLCFLMITSCSLVHAQHVKGSRSGKAKYNSKRTTSTNLKRNKTDIFPLERIYKLGGLSVAPGLTYMWPESQKDFTNDFNDTSFQYNINPAGKIGLYLEVGWFHSFADPVFFHFMDFGLSFKQLKGEERLTTSLNDLQGNTISTAPEQTFQFNDQHLTGHVNFTHHRHFSRYGFVNNSIGINLDYGISNSRDPGINFPGRTQNFPGTWIGQLHYKLGIGWKASEQILVIPSIETPLLTFLDFDGFKSRTSYFSSKYRPLIFSIRIMFIRKDPENCNVPNYDGPKNFE